MGDCTNHTMKDLLPDLLTDRLSAADRADVQSHVDACGDCRADLALLSRVRAAAVTPRVDTARIVAALPPAYRAGPSLRRALGSAAWKVAAVLLLVTGAVLAGRRVVGERSPLTPVAQAPLADSPRVALRDSSPTNTRVPASPRAKQSPPAELAMGESLHDLSDSDLRALLDALGKLDAVTSSETEIVVPAIGGAGE